MSRAKYYRLGLHRRETDSSEISLIMNQSVDESVSSSLTEPAALAEHQKERVVVQFQSKLQAALPPDLTPGRRASSLYSLVQESTYPVPRSEPSRRATSVEVRLAGTANRRPRMSVVSDTPLPSPPEDCPYAEKWKACNQPPTAVNGGKGDLTALRSSPTLLSLTAETELEQGPLSACAYELKERGREP
jgi:hypothetical protein